MLHILFNSFVMFHDLQHVQKEKKKHTKDWSDQILSICVLNPCKEVDVGYLDVIVLGYAVIRNTGGKILPWLIPEETALYSNQNCKRIPINP